MNMAKPGKSHLTLYIVIAIAAAVVVALFAPHQAMKFKIGGDIFLNLLKMMVVPLVMASVMNGILGMGDVRKLGKPGGYTILYYLSTTLLAVGLGLVVVNVIQPGVGAVDEATLAKLKDEGSPAQAKVKVREALAESTGLDEEVIAGAFADLPEPTGELDVWMIMNNLIEKLFTDNLFMAAAETNLLPLILFSIVFAALLSTMGKRVATITEMIGQVNDALLSFIMLLMNIAPLGIFCLVTARFGKAVAGGTFMEELSQIGWYMGTVLVGLGLHVFVTLPLIYWVVTRKNPYRFLMNMSQALLTAFSTASSSATLPVTMECAITKAGVSKRSTEFVIPLGSTINMDGTALYEAAAAIFIAQAIGMELSLIQQLTIAITATLAAIGAAGIPEAGLVTMIIVLNAVGLPIEYVGLILSVDWLLDRFRTAVNAAGDSIGAAVVEKAFDAAGEPEST
jgi:solute carrier family 1 (high affinity glutamate transporter) protein 1